MMNFFMDENFVAHCLNSLADRLPELEKIVDVMDKVSSSPPTNLYYTHDLHSLSFQEISFAELLYAHSSDGDYRDLILRFDMALERGECVLTEENRVLEASDVELARLGAGGYITGLDYSAKNWWCNSKMYIVSDETTYLNALRFLFNALDMPAEQLEVFSDLLFPNIYFHASPSNLKRMGISYRDHSQSIIAHLSYLNDFAILHFENDLPATIIQLAASKGVEISPESVKTHGNRGAMARRRVEINDSHISCEWHTKFTYDKGRIHFHARPNNYQEKIRKLVGSKVIVGLIVEHLPT